MTGRRPRRDRVGQGGWQRRAPRFALALLAGLSCWAAAGRAGGHEPFEITADARTGVAETTLRLLIAGQTARRLCGALPQAQDDGRWRRCGGALFTLAGAEGRPLPVRQVDARVTVEGDVAVAVTYPAAGPGALRFEAAFLQRLPDPTYGATLTITGPGVFLARRVLRASAPSLVVVVPSPPIQDTTSPTHGEGRRQLGAAGLALLAAVTIGTAATLALRARRRAAG